MNDHDFDLLMRQASSTPTLSQDTLSEIVLNARRQVHARPRRGRRAAVVGGVVAGTLLLAAGASTTVLLLQQAPYQGLEQGVSRASVAIPVDYVSASGADNHCQAYLELRNATPGLLRQADDFAASHDWTGLGQRAYDAAFAAGGDVDTITSALGSEVSEQLRTAAVAALPISETSSGADDALPAWSGSAMYCPGGQR